MLYNSKKTKQNKKNSTAFEEGKCAFRPSDYQKRDVTVAGKQRIWLVRWTFRGFSKVDKTQASNDYPW